MRTYSLRAGFCVLGLVLGGCSSSGNGGPTDGGQVGEELAGFAGAYAEAVCAQYVECGCDDFTESYCKSRMVQEAVRFFTSGFRSEKRFNAECTQAILEAIDEYGCKLHLIDFEKIGLGDACESYCGPNAGDEAAGESCRGEDLFLYPVSDCLAGLLCGGDGKCVQPCDAWFSDDLPAGGVCEQGWEVVGTCAEGLVCDSNATDTCIALPGEGQTCLYDQCLPGLWCEIIVSTKTCRALLPGGEHCSVDRACWSGQCASNACTDADVPLPGICEYVNSILSEAQRCKNDADCDDLDPCTGDSCRDGDCVYGPPCDDHGECRDTQPRSCLCDPGYVGQRCEECAPTHTREADGSCVPDPDPERFLLASVNDDELGKLLAAIDIDTAEVFPLVSIGADTCSLAFDPQTGTVYAMNEDYPRNLSSVDLATGGMSTVQSLSFSSGGYHEVNGLTFDTQARTLIGHAQTGAAHYTISYQVDDDQFLQGNFSRDFDEVDFAYDPASGLVLGIGQGHYPPLKTFTLEPYGQLLSVEALGAGLDKPGLTLHPNGNLYFAGNRKLTYSQWAVEYCRLAAVEFGAEVPAVVFGGYGEEGLPDGDAEIVSDPGGAAMFAYGLYGSEGDPPRNVRISLSEDADIFCMVTYEAPTHVIVSAGANFQIIVLASWKPAFTIEVEAGFTPNGLVDPPIRHAVTTAEEPPANDLPDLVETYGYDEWFWTHYLTHASYDQDLVFTPVFGTLDWDTGEVSVHELEGLTLMGGLTSLE